MPSPQWQRHWKISEHARGDALDLMGVQWVRGDAMAFTDPAMDLALATNLRASLCDRFSRSLAPPLTDSTKTTSISILRSVRTAENCASGI